MPHLVFPVWFWTACPQERLNFLIKVACAYGTTSGTIGELSELTGIGKSSITAAKQKGRFGETNARRMQDFVGRDLIKWEWLVDTNAVISEKGL